MSVAGVHRFSLPLPPKCSLRTFSVLANGKRTQSLLPHHFSVFNQSHRLVTSLSHNVSNKSDAEAERSCDEGEMLDKNRISKKNPFVSEELLKKLKRYGLSGILSYGLLNTVYYSTAFLLVWFYVAPAPGKMGYLAAAERFLKVMAMVWAGSQVTKLIRIGGAVALAPIVDRGLSWFTVKCNFESQGKAFGALVGICLGMALMLFIVVTLLWA
ncbi:Gag-Pol polyprotein/retrotransposon [Arabidopsis thaliana]|uniref:Gag-Pol polyprotein/retrotransposon n=1 Tax=Arabidopsis thaliana TaxID=3702 RepID=Q6DSR9_ARATH|nr:Gag-Pol polyprotein/retrotransposon [Arabidopsis thaliana]AAT68740.1 hypothetical protein At2g38695 [Arabidopsis thaliana]AAV63895.1 hypothetical protein At2g38695 [Arabidopsis thaliana]AEC09571.1 Gag-Pol polyprotein/retrotransposon [Arabidopsis thaliana]|eukprot:NP_973635.2 Gag-Pol polyprotein/retrotransposon [Arabidopsis thaliana]